MASPQFVLDENLRDGRLGLALNSSSSPIQDIDIVRVGDLPEIPLGISDDALVAWASAEGRILVSRDLKTLIRPSLERCGHASGQPGRFLVRAGISIRELRGWLRDVAMTTSDQDWIDGVFYVP